jgi:hypothetical protein
MASIRLPDDWKTLQEGLPWNTPVQLKLADGKIVTGLFRALTLQFEDLDGNRIKPLVVHWKARS